MYNTAMHTSWLSAEQYSKLSTQVSGAFIAPLPAFNVLSVEGDDRYKYLQGQTTCDITALHAENFLRGAHCDAKGKMWSIFHTYQADDKLMIVAFREELFASETQWRKFGVFSKVRFNSDNQQLAVLGIAGDNTDALVTTLGFTPPTKDGQLCRHNDSYLLRLAKHHMLLVMPQQQAQCLGQAALPWAAPTLWYKSHILHGLSYLEQPLIGELVPQMLNLHAVDAISFTKGCYVGQETVARLKYRGGNKRAAYILYALTSNLPPAGSDIELQLDNNWRRVGQVVNAVNIDNQLWLIALLPNDITPDNILRLKGEEPTLLQQLPLPYSLT